LRTRQSASRRFVSVHILVPGNWSVHQAHHFVEKIEDEIIAKIPKATVSTHLEPAEDKLSWNDVTIDKKKI
jgi:divalent metal cation (Fe/Co/Zn/Cd) transporter